MSVKIFNGFKVSFPKMGNGSINQMSDLLVLIGGFRPWVEAEARKMIDSFIDNVSAHTGKTKDEAYIMWMEETHKVGVYGNIQNPILDFKFQLVFFPTNDGFLGISFTTQDSWHQKWLTMEGVSEYGYWNNVDPPDELSDEEWMTRCKTWERFEGVPAMIGFTIDVTNPSGYTPTYIIENWRKKK